MNKLPASPEASFSSVPANDSDALVPATDQAKTTIERTLRGHSLRFGAIAVREVAGTLKVSGWVTSYYGVQLVIGALKKETRLALPFEVDQLKVMNHMSPTRS